MSHWIKGSKSMEVKKYNRAILQINWETLKNWCSVGKEHRFRVLQGIPQDAKIVAIRNNAFTFAEDVIEIIIESDELPEIQEGDILNVHNLLFETMPK